MSGCIGIDGLMYFDDDLQDFGPETAPRLLYYRESNRENRISTCLARMRAVVWTGGKSGKSAKARGGERGENAPSLPLPHSIHFLYWGSVLLLHPLLSVVIRLSQGGGNGIPIYPIDTSKL